MKEFLITLSTLIIVVLIFIVIVGISNDLMYRECSAKAKALNYKYDYGFWQGCVLIKSDGKKILLDQLRDFDK